LTILETSMARRKTPIGPTPAGTVLAVNLIRLGFAETVVKTTEVARLVTEKTGHKMSRQRVANLLNAIKISPETFELIAKALGVEVSELTRPPED
jgi:hypothetical protein